VGNFRRRETLPLWGVQEAVFRLRSKKSRICCPIRCRRVFLTDTPRAFLRLPRMPPLFLIDSNDHSPPPPCAQSVCNPSSHRRCSAARVAGGLVSEPDQRALVWGGLPRESLDCGRDIGERTRGEPSDDSFTSRAGLDHYSVCSNVPERMVVRFERSGHRGYVPLVERGTCNLHRLGTRTA
jgi:hypothetical protein